MKKRWMALVLMLCLGLWCGFAQAAEEPVKVGDFASFQAALNNKAAWIKLTSDITLTQSVTVDYKVHIELNGKFINKPSEGSGVQLMIVSGAEATIGVKVDNVTSLDFFFGGVRADVENHGLINGSAAFYGKVTNYGEIAAADCFYGEYIPMDGSSNSSYAELTLDLDTYVPASAPEGWEQAKDLLSKKILRGQKLSQPLPSISRAGYDLKGWLVAKDQPFDESSPITGDITVKANWSLKQGTVLHELKFDANGGNIAMDSQWFVMGETRTLNDCDTSKETNWNFLGWNTKQDPPTGKAYANQDTFTYDGTATTLYAQWEKNKEFGSTDGICSVSYYSGEQQLYIDGNLSYYSSPYALKTLETLQGYWDFNPDFSMPEDKRFAGWTEDLTDPNAKVYQPGEKFTLVYGKDRTFYAVWKDIREDNPTPTPTPIPVPTMAPDAPQIPRTGDSAPLGLWVALIVVSCIGVAAGLLHDRKREN